MDRPRQPRAQAHAGSRVATVLLVLVCATGLGAAIALWTVGAWTTIDLRTGTTLLGASVAAGLIGLVGARSRSVLGWAGWPATLASVASLAGGIAFPLTLYLATPGAVASWARGGPSEGWSSVEAPRRLRVVQLNVFHDYPRFDDAERRIDGIGAALEQLDPDVVVLQEAWATSRIENVARGLGRRLDLHAAYARGNGSRRLLGFEEGVAVLARWPLGRSRVVELSPRKHPFDRRIALSVEVEVPGGDPVRVVASHLTNEAPAVTAAQAGDLVGELERDPAARSTSAVLVAGDLNASAGSAALRPFRQAGWRAIRQGDRDHLLLNRESSDWRPMWSELVELASAAGTPGEPLAPLSDHPAIVAELEAVGPPRASRWRGSWGRAPSARPDLDAATIVRAAEAIGELQGIEAVLVVHDGALVAERYFRGAGPERLQNMKSASKSVLSALVGIAIEEGHLRLDDPISEHLPTARGLDDRRKAAITVRDLLGMRSGLESTSFGNYGSWVSSRDWVRNALERPLQAEPGSDFAYSTGDTHILSAVLAAATGGTTLGFAREHLFEPLGIGRVAWERDPQGIHVGGNNLAMRPRDMARFGLLYLDRGRWGERQVVPWGWVDQSTVPIHPRWRRGWGGGYGYLWWIRSDEERGAYNASGYGGQYILVFRAEDLVVVVSSTEAGKPRGWRGDLFSRIRDGIVAPVRALPRREAPRAFDVEASAGG